MIEIIKSVDCEGCRITVEYDCDAENPRKCSDNLGTILCWNHPRYHIGDVIVNRDEPLRPEGVTQKKFLSDYISMPVYMHDHSGVKLSTVHNGCHWDTFLIGVMYVNYADLKEAYNAQSVTKTIRTFAKQVMKAELETYSKYFNGEVFLVKLERPNHQDEYIGGFYSVEDAIEAAKEIIAREGILA